MQKNNKYFQKLEVNIVIDKLSTIAVNEKVKKYIGELKPINDYQTIKEELDTVDEFLTIVTRFERPGIQIEADLDKIIERASKGAILSGIELYEIVKLDSTIKNCEKLLTNIQKEKLCTPYFNDLLERILDFNNLYVKIKNAIEYDGTIFDDASLKLKQVRASLKSMDVKIKQKLNEILSKESKKLSEPLIVLRDNAYCIPIRAEYKNTIKGIIHDTSASMQTVYIEPYAITELNLQKEKLINEEYDEINVILSNLSKLVEDNYDTLKNNFSIVKRIDFISSKAILAKEMAANKPLLRNDGHFNLINARHPLLNVEKIVSNTITMEEPTLGIIITGPNTGGKTVLLKTVGLLSLMIKFGLLIPCDEGSSISVFDKVFCDIGDDQSISSNLSTFSSHMSSIIDIINKTTTKSLVLFDEIGSGTDPLEGSSLAIAILKYLIDNNVTFITTTHYSELKIFGFNEEKIINASMEFDDKTLSPTYRLLLGVTGSSNAFSIATRMGLKKEIIDTAKNLVSSTGDENHLMIEKFEEKSLAIKKLENKLQNEMVNNQKLKDEYEKKLDELDKNRHIQIENAKREAEIIIEQAKYDASKIIEKVEKLNKDNPKLHDIASIKHEIRTIEVKKEPKVIVNQNYEYKVGDDVYVPAYDQYGTIDRISNNKYDVSIGNIKLTLKKNDFQPAKSENVNRNIVSKIGKDQVSKSTKKASLTLDLRGKRYEEAKDELDNYLDDLVLLGMKQGIIIHGFGTGTIRNLVQNFVKNNSNVKEYRYGGENEGGLGVTVITLK